MLVHNINRMATTQSSQESVASKKIRTRMRLQACALRLFGEHGFDATTVAQIAAEAGTSEMTFFRYFPSKAAVVESDEFDPVIAAAIASRPARERPVTAVGEALASSLRQLDEAQCAALRQRLQLIQSTQTLRSHWWERQRANEELIGEVIAARTDAEPDTLAVRVLAAACVAAAGTALIAWADGDADAEPAEVLADAFAALR